VWWVYIGTFTIKIRIRKMNLRRRAPVRKKRHRERWGNWVGGGQEPGTKKKTGETKTKKVNTGGPPRRRETKRPEQGGKETDGKKGTCKRYTESWGT